MNHCLSRVKGVRRLPADGRQVGDQLQPPSELGHIVAASLLAQQPVHHLAGSPLPQLIDGSPLQEPVEHFSGLYVVQPLDGGAEVIVLRAGADQMQLARPFQHRWQSCLALAQPRYVAHDEGPGPVGDTHGIQHAMHHIQVAQLQPAVR